MGLKKKRKKEEPNQNFRNGSSSENEQEEEETAESDDEYLHLLSSIQHPLAQVSLIHGPEEHLTKTDFSSLLQEPLQPSKKTLQGQLLNGLKVIFVLDFQDLVECD